MKANDINKAAMKKNVRDEIKQERKNKRIHDNASQ
jgi:hypothetical protein